MRASEKLAHNLRSISQLDAFFIHVSKATNECLLFVIPLTTRLAVVILFRGYPICHSLINKAE
ncbi:hypothetical protein VCRA2120E57_70075 [Vibrio crassostreae]|nr:hypothetical protein VCRA2120E57_70075 [Vibrio crassostreae]